MNNDQLEIGFDHPLVRRSYRARRTSRAKWWFEQMRRVVDSAFDWKTAPAARPEQIHLRLAR